MNRLTITQDELKAVLHYCPETGVFTRIKTQKKIAVSPIENDYYSRIFLYGKKHSAHLLAWLYMTGTYPEEEIDHINQKKKDNRFSNLRLSSRTMNNCNIRLLKSNTSGAKGVRLQYWGKYEARINVKGKTYNGGFFDTLDEAAHAYNKLAVKHFGEFAILNPIGSDYKL